jgi:carboxylate-amine ligase
MTSAEVAPDLRHPGIRPEVGTTFGIEEEFHVIDPETFDVLDDPALSRATMAGLVGSRVHPEIATTQIETASAICRSLGDVRRELTVARREAADAAALVGGTVLAASTHPFASWQQQRLTARPRYLALYEKWGVLALQQVICGCHVHVAVPDLDTAVAVMDHARPYLPSWR